MSGKSSFVMIRLTDTPIWTDFIAMEEGLTYLPIDSRIDGNIR
jgi:hypothetical protein